MLNNILAESLFAISVILGFGVYGVSLLLPFADTSRFWILAAPFAGMLIVPVGANAFYSVFDIPYRRAAVIAAICCVIAGILRVACRSCAMVVAGGCSRSPPCRLLSASLRSDYSCHIGLWAHRLFWKTLELSGGVDGCGSGPEGFLPSAFSTSWYWLPQQESSKAAPPRRCYAAAYRRQHWPHKLSPSEIGSSSIRGRSGMALSCFSQQLQAGHSLGHYF